MKSSSVKNIIKEVLSKNFFWYTWKSTQHIVMTQNTVLSEQQFHHTINHWINERVFTNKDKSYYWASRGWVNKATDFQF